MFLPTPKELKLCWFSLCTDCRPPLGDSWFYYNKVIFLSSSKPKNIDYKDGIFYVDGVIESFDTLEQLKEIWRVEHFEGEDKLNEIKEKHPDLSYDPQSGFYYSRFCEFRKKEWNTICIPQVKI